MESNYCQSCAMPLGDTGELYGTEADGGKNELYCKYCYEAGAFTVDCSMEEMIEISVSHMADMYPGIDQEEARKNMQSYFPDLARWKN